MYLKKVFAISFFTICMASPVSVNAQTLNPEDIGKPISAQEKLSKVGVPELRRMVNDAYSQEDYTALKDALLALREIRPYNSEYMFQLVLAHALLNDKSAAYDTMLKMQRQGLSYDFDKAPEAENIRNTDVYKHINDLMVHAGEPLGEADVVAQIDANISLPDSLVWDPSRESFLVGSIADGLILQMGADGDRKELVRADDNNGLWGIYGLAVDAERNRLYASSASNPQFKGAKAVNQGRSVVIEFQLDTLEILKRYPVPADGRPHILDKMAVGPAGEVYVADALLPMVYLLDPGKPTLRPFFSMSYLVSLRDVDISSDGKKLYIADHEMGVTVINLESGRSRVLRTPDNLNMGGIEGLQVWENSLVMVQSGIRPQRIMRLDLGPEGDNVTAVAPVAVGLEIFDSPKNGATVADEFYFLANSQWGKEEPAPVSIAKVNIADTPTMVDPNLEKLVDQYRKAQAAGRVRSGDAVPEEGEK